MIKCIYKYFSYFPKWSLIESMVISPTERSLLLFNCEVVSPFVNPAMLKLGNYIKRNGLTNFIIHTIHFWEILLFIISITINRCN